MPRGSLCHLHLLTHSISPDERFISCLRKHQEHLFSLQRSNEGTDRPHWTGQDMAGKAIFIQNNICHNIEEKRQTVKNTLAKAREDCLNLVNKHFDDLEHRINSEIVNETKKNSLHSAYRLETLNTLMLKEMSNLLMYSKDLSSNKFLETAKIVEEDVFPNSREFHLKVCKELKENEVYTATAVYKEECLADLVYSLKRLVNLEFLLPRVEYVEGPPKFERADKLDDARRSFSLKRNNSAIVMSRPHDLRISQLAPKHTTSIVMSSNSNPLNLLQQYAMNRSEVASPMLHKSSRLSNCSNFASNLQSGLKIIRETKRENTQAENRSMTNSSVSCTNKENDLARSCYIDTGSSFYNRWFTCHYLSFILFLFWLDSAYKGSLSVLSIRANVA